MHQLSHKSFSLLVFRCCGSKISRWGCRPPTQALFGKNVHENEQIGSCWGRWAHAGGASWICQCLWALVLMSMFWTADGHPVFKGRLNLSPGCLLVVLLSQNVMIYSGRSTYKTFAHPPTPSPPQQIKFFHFYIQFC